MKKSVCISIILLVLSSLVSCGDIIVYTPPSDTESEYQETSRNTDGSTLVTEESESFNNENKSLKEQFRNIGLNEDEAEDLQNKFQTMGITEISNIELAIGDGIDGLQSFKAKVFDYDSLTLIFTIEHRKLCHVEIAGFPIDKVEWYINFWGKLDYKIVDSTRSIVFYDVWDENGEIIENAIGYKAVFDYGENTIRAYSEQK